MTPGAHLWLLPLGLDVARPCLFTFLEPLLLGYEAVQPLPPPGCLSFVPKAARKVLRQRQTEPMSSPLLKPRLPSQGHLYPL